MSNLFAQAKLRPVYTVAADGNGQGLAIQYGAGIGAVRFLALDYYIYDSSGGQLLEKGFITRAAAINGIYRGDPSQFLWNTDLSGYDVLYDSVTHTALAHISPRHNPTVTDPGEPLTVLVSKLLWPPGPPPAILPVTIANLSADYSRLLKTGPPINAQMEGDIR